jgi:flagellar assembly protein FliH
MVTHWSFWFGHWEFSGMGLIKSESSRAAAASPFSMADIERQAHALIAQAKSQAARILSEAQRMADEMKEQSKALGLAEGQADGFQQGLKDGHEAGRQEALNEQREALAELVQALASACSDLDSSRRRLESEAVTDVMRLAVAIARKATKRLGALDDHVVTGNLTEAMKLTVHASDVRIAVAPSQKKTLDDALPDLRMQWPALRHVELVADESLAPGGCRIFSNAGQVHADLDGQIDRIAAELIPDTTGAGA